jgi:predicted nucleic acid-binding protein
LFVWVVDASIVLEVLLRTAVGLRHEDRLLQSRQTLHVPHLLDVEVAQVLRRLTLADEIPAERAQVALQTLAAWPLVRHEHTSFLGRVWQLRAAVTAYDAVYLALAEGLDAPLLTCDAKLSRSHGHRARIEFLS